MASVTGSARGKAHSTAGRREDVLAALRDADAPMTITAIATELGVHPNTVRFHLDGLTSEGRAERVEPDRRGPGRPPLLFRAARRMDPAGTRRYQLLAEILALGFDEGATSPLEAGRAWAKREAAPAPPRADATTSTDRLVTLLDGLGFAPQRRVADGRAADEAQIGLRHCPFLELAKDKPSVVCQVHLGLMQGALETWDSPVTVEGLTSFVEPDLCLARLGTFTK